MPRYFFDVHGDCREQDRGGVELVDIAAAKSVAVAGIDPRVEERAIRRRDSRMVVSRC